ncbi:MAG: DNA repair protein RadA [Candidatus Anoxychlamydiales bacterium]|nr:DNA repair protein RadA [Candidatus Anoxychlamydiales bacterium]
MAKDKCKSIWECSSCGFTQSKWSGSCLSCSSWNSFFEKIQINEKAKRFEAKKNDSRPIRLKDVKISSFKRLQTNFTHLDRLFGGGIVQGSLVLIGGNPGIGKSTLLLQLSNIFALKNLKVLYISGEESLEQTTIRASRINATSDNIFIYSETNFSSIKLQIDQLKPDILIVDSIQILYKQEISSSPGSVVQVRELAMEFMHIAKGYGITTFLIGHVTKTGDIAGPRVLEHIVDVVLDFEGEKQNGFRLLRSVKNRFGPTDDIAIFQMNEKGLNEIKNPSQIFLEKRTKNLPGSVIASAIEGIRSILIEVQALVASSGFSNPTRKCSGLDQNRLSILLAVLEKKIRFQIKDMDVFVSIAGGIKIKEPAIDLAILLAIASSFSNRNLSSNTVVIGEVGLSGEIRAVTRIESRIKEAINMGFENILLPKQNLKEITSSLKEKINIFPVDVVEEAIDILK